MVSHLFFYQLVLVALVWLCVMLHWTWPSDPAPVWPTTPEPLPPLRKRKREPTPTFRDVDVASENVGRRYTAVRDDDGRGLIRGA